jgi:hypothetical protein
VAHPGLDLMIAVWIGAISGFLSKGFLLMAARNNEDPESIQVLSKIWNIIAIIIVLAVVTVKIF